MKKSLSCRAFQGRITRVTFKTRLKFSIYLFYHLSYVFEKIHQTPHLHKFRALFRVHQIIALYCVCVQLFN